MRSLPSPHAHDWGRLQPSLHPHCKCHGNCGSQGHSNGPGESLAPEHFLYGSPNSKTVPARHGFESSAKAQAQDPSSLWPHGPPCPPHQKEVGGGRPPHRPPGDAESPHVQAARGLGAVPRAPEPLPATPPTERAPGRRGLGARRGPGAPSSYSAARASAALPSGGILRVMNPSSMSITLTAGPLPGTGKAGHRPRPLRKAEKGSSGSRHLSSLHSGNSSCLGCKVA